MADWCRMDADLPRHPKTLYLSGLLGTDVKATVGALALLWLFCTEHAKDGVLSEERRNLRGIARRMDLQPMLDDDVLRHLVSAGYVEQETDGSFTVHDYLERNGYKLRELERKRAVARKWRATDRVRGAPKARLRRRRRDVDVDVDGKTFRDQSNVVAGRTGVAGQAPAPSATEPAGPSGSDGIASRFKPGAMKAVEAAFPAHDVELIARKLLTEIRPGADLDRALWRWAESARAKGTELKVRGHDLEAERRRADQIAGSKFVELDP